MIGVGPGARAATWARVARLVTVAELTVVADERRAGFTAKHGTACLAAVADIRIVAEAVVRSVHHDVSNFITRIVGARDAIIGVDRDARKAT